MSPSATDVAAANAQVDAGDFDVASAIVRDSNVVEATVTGESRIASRAYAAALLDTSTLTFKKLYPRYSVTPLRAPTTSDEVPRQVLTMTLIGAVAGAVFAYLFVLGHRREPAAALPRRINPTPFAQARIGSDLASTPRPPRRPRPHRPAPR